VRVASSARRNARCHGGFADYLSDLADEVLEDGGSTVRRDAG
jgi:hypothetical protein